MVQVVCFDDEEVDWDIAKTKKATSSVLFQNEIALMSRSVRIPIQCGVAPADLLAHVPTEIRVEYLTLFEV